jgi:hypothetical protein
MSRRRYEPAPNEAHLTLREIPHRRFGERNRTSVSGRGRLFVNSFEQRLFEEMFAFFFAVEIFKSPHKMRPIVSKGEST